MGQPVDRLPGVRLITDYGALDWALNKQKEMEEKKSENSLQLDADCSCGIHISECDC